MASEYQLTIADDDSWTLTLSDQGVAIPSTHASSHGSAGSDPITIAYSQVTGLGTMSTQAASSVSITGGSIAGITDLAVADGGTGASNASDARTNLGLGNMATQAKSAVDITGGTIVGITDLAVADGGTGASNASDARTNLGLGNMATQAKSAVDITGGTVAGVTISTSTLSSPTVNSPTISGGSITGITDLAVADGGTGASTASAARTSLDVPATNSTIRWRSDITAFTGGASNALDSIDISNTTTYPTGACLAFSVSGDLVVYRITATGAGESSPTVIRPDSYGGREWTLVSILESNVAITGGSITGITDLAVGDGGTGASTLTGTLIGNGTSAFTAATSSTAGQVLRCTGANTFAYGALDLADADATTGVLPLASGGTGGSTAATARTNLGFVSGSGTLTGTTPVVVSIPGVTASSDIVANHRTNGFGTQGELTIEPGTDQITVHSDHAADNNDFTYFGVL